MIMLIVVMTMMENIDNLQKLIPIMNNKGIGDAGSTADLRMLWSAIVRLGLL